MYSIQVKTSTTKRQLQLLETTIITIISPAGCNTDEHRVYQSHHAGRRPSVCPAGAVAVLAVGWQAQASAGHVVVGAEWPPCCFLLFVRFLENHWRICHRSATLLFHSE